MKKKHIKELDRLIQGIASRKRSVVSHQTPCVGHHVVKRSNLLYRWDIDNIIPLTLEEHTKHHAGNLKLSYTDYQVEIMNDKTGSFKEILLENGMIGDDFYLVMKRKLEKELANCR